MNKEDLNLATVLVLLRDNGIMYAGCYYSGGGDSGDIDSMAYFSEEEFGERFKADDVSLDYGEEGDMEFEHEHIDMIENFLQDVYLTHLNNVEDWWNNDGGYGSLIMDTATGEFKNENNTYYTQTSTEHHTGRFQAE